MLYWRFRGDSGGGALAPQLNDRAGPSISLELSSEIAIAPNGER